MRHTTRMTVKAALFAGTLCAAVGMAGSAKAEPKTHDGFYLQLDAGLGYLSSSVSFSGTGAPSGSQTWKGFSIPTGILLGGTVGPVVIGGGFVSEYAPSPSLGGVNSAGLTGVHLYLFEFNLFADYYVDPHGGLHFQPFIGYGALTATCDGCTSNAATGIDFGLGVGYDFWVGNEWSIGPMARFVYAPLTYTPSGTNIDENFSTIAPSLMATFTYH